MQPGAGQNGLGAGVRKPSREETAGEMAPIGLHARKLWGFEGCGLGVGEWTNRSRALVDRVWVHERSVWQRYDRIER